MIEKFYYKSSAGDIVPFGENGIVANGLELRSYDWTPSVSNGFINGFSKDLVEKPFTSLFYSWSDEETTKHRNNAFVVFERDVRAGRKGRIYMGDYYLSCWITGAENPKRSNRFIVTNWKIVTDTPLWIAEETKTILRQVQDENEDGMDFPYDYPYDYSPRMNSIRVFNNRFDFNCRFELTIFGPASNPYIEIGGQRYGVTRPILSGERVVINSLTKTVEKIGNNVSENWFGYRYKEQSVFEPIPNGTSNLHWDGTFGFNVTLFDERSEPPMLSADVIPDGTLLDATGALLITSDGFVLEVS